MPLAGRLFYSMQYYPGLLLILLLALLRPAPASAQPVPLPDVPTTALARDTVAPDSTVSVSLSDLNRGPRRALLWSIIPGGGQVYNRAWWKVPLVYGGLLGVIAYADFNQTQYSRFVTALEARCLGDGNVVIPPNAECLPKESEFPIDDVATASLVTARNNANRARQTAYIGILIAYVLQGVEAYTDAHLRDFDISDDLSLRVRPVVVPGVAVGVGVTVELK